MRSFRTISIYTYKEFILSFVVAFLFFFFLFFVNNILLLAEDVLSKDVPPGDVVLLIIYSLPSVLSISCSIFTLSLNETLFVTERSGQRCDFQ